MTRLSVNINKVATLRNARGENVPDVVKFATDCERFGAQGITVHPRPDERHIRRDDVPALKKVLTTEFNIEGFPSEEFLQLVEQAAPAQVTLVPDAADVLTSSSGWDVDANFQFLAKVVERLHAIPTRVSIFVGADTLQVERAAQVGADRVELYTKPYADNYETDREAAIAPFIEASMAAHNCRLGVNAGHDLNLRNLSYFHAMMPYLDEVSIGHAIISDALYLGIERTIVEYLDRLK